MRKKPIHVAVGILINSSNEVLVALRPDNLHQGGLWEFPGGKVEPEETVLSALRREFLEEVNLSILHAEPFMEVHHDYGDKQVWLDVWISHAWEGQEAGCEGQQVRWADADELNELEFPAANVAILEKTLAYLRE